MRVKVQSTSEMALGYLVDMALRFELQHRFLHAMATEFQPHRYKNI